MKGYKVNPKPRSKPNPYSRAARMRRRRSAVVLGAWLTGLCFCLSFALSYQQLAVTPARPPADAILNLDQPSGNANLEPEAKEISELLFGGAKTEPGPPSRLELLCESLNSAAVARLPQLAGGKRFAAPGKKLAEPLKPEIAAAKLQIEFGLGALYPARPGSAALPELPQALRLAKSAMFEEMRIASLGVVSRSSLRASLERNEVRMGIDYAARHPKDPEKFIMILRLALAGKHQLVFAPTRQALAAVEEFWPGKLSARFESGERGALAVGYTLAGGTCYGIFQIASRTGTFKAFLKYLDERAPNLSHRLRRAGPADTGGRQGGMPEAWKVIAAEHPGWFEKLQYEFILSTHYRPAKAEIIGQTSLDVDALSPAVREVLWSAAVQHGPRAASEMFVSAARRLAGPKSRLNGAKNFEQALIEEVYLSRLKVYDDRPGPLRAALKIRFDMERSLALGMLNSERAALDTSKTMPNHRFY